MSTEPTPRRLRWHGWVFAVFVLFLYANGAWDFVKTMSADAQYLQDKGFAPQAEAYFTDYPGALMLLFAVNVATALAATIALPLRPRAAARLAVASAVTMTLLDALTFGLRGRWQALGPFIGWFDLGLLAITIGFAGYCVWWARSSAAPSSPG